MGAIAEVMWEAEEREREEEACAAHRAAVEADPRCADLVARAKAAEVAGDPWAGMAWFAAMIRHASISWENALRVRI